MSDDASGHGKRPNLDRLVENVWTRLLSRGSMIATAGGFGLLMTYAPGAIRDFSNAHVEIAQTLALIKQQMDTDRKDARQRDEAIRQDMATEFKLRDFRLDQHDRGFTNIYGRLQRLELLPIQPQRN